ncbi:E3 SUMO-protein ligase ZBED1-like [Anastrepha obliqua]|uniref:E3 SUMO-protein ligase ZBED1-like n=1 Tax=Anastrepha obliqua TaxID=95512 RepID=UPI0024097AF6|nr:E3 SUMO-protein ligase ZBED1-like [Anastrepha obliqua]
MEVLQKIKSGEYKIIPGIGTSAIWNYFNRIVFTTTEQNIPFVICSYCGKIFKFGKGASSSNLKKHKCYKRQIAEESDSVLGANDQLRQEEASSSNLNKSNCCKRQSTEESGLIPMKKRLLVGVSDQLQEEVLHNYVKYISRDLRPFDAVDDDGFKEFARCLIEVGIKLGKTPFSIDDILPHSTTVSSRLQSLHIAEREKFVADLRPIIERGDCAATIDLWTDSKKHQSFIAFTVHYLDTDWKFQSRILFATEYEYYDENEGTTNNTAENIIGAIGDKFEELHLEKDLLKQITFTTDQKPNIIEACHNYSRINCVADVLNLILKHTFDKETLKSCAPNVFKLITTGKSLVKYLELVEVETSVKQECCFRWNTQFDMLCAIHKNFNVIEEILETSWYHLTKIEKDLQRVINILEPFKSASLILEEENNATIHLVLLHMHILKEKLLKLLNEKSNNGIPAIVENCLQNIFNEKFCPDKIHKIAAFLWPEYKQLRYLTELEREEVYNLVKVELIKMASSEIPQGVSVTSVKMESSNSDDILSKYKDVPLMANNTSENQINLQIEMYKNSCYPESNTLNWWRLHGDEFPLLAKLARQILCIPASTARSERCFRTAKRISAERKTRIEAENLEAILFLHSQQKQQEIIF